MTAPRDRRNGFTPMQEARIVRDKVSDVLAAPEHHAPHDLLEVLRDVARVLPALIQTRDFIRALAELDEAPAETIRRLHTITKET